MSNVNSGALKVTDTQFHHVAVTKSAASVIFYVDGVAGAPINYDPGFTFTTNLSIGRNGDAGADSFLGQVDELSIYNRALSASEIQSIFNAGSEGKTTLVVNSTADDNDGSCDDLTVGDCTLREAINASNSSTGNRDVIGFDIPGTGVHTISPTSGLPAITNPVIIDGYTQPGASANTLANGSNAVLLIELSGNLLPANNTGLFITAGSKHRARSRY